MAVGDKRRRRPSEPSMRPHQYGLRLSDAENDLIIRAAGDRKVTAFLVETGLAAAQERRFTRAEVDDALEAATTLLIDGLRPDGLKLAERDVDLLRLAAEAVLAKLTDPDVTLDQVITAAYEDPPAHLRAWWTGWS